MKLSAREASQFCRSPDRKFRAALIYGEDSDEISRRRAQLVMALVGDGEDHNVKFLDAGQARREPGLITDSLRSQGFFGGEPVVVIEGGADGLAAGLAEVLKDVAEDDAFLIVTAGILPARSKLRKLFEGEAAAVAAPCYREALGRQDIMEILKEAGVGDVQDEALRDLVDFSRSSETGALRDLITRLALYSLSETEALSCADVLACLPGSGDANVDDLLDAVADGEADRIGQMVSKLRTQGVNATTLVISMMRKFKQLHAIAAVGGPSDAVLSRLRPPVFGPRRDRLSRQARHWSLVKCEGALKLIVETDLALRGGAVSPDYPLLERALIRLALGAKR